MTVHLNLCCFLPSGIPYTTSQPPLAYHTILFTAEVFLCVPLYCALKTLSLPTDACADVTLVGVWMTALSCAVLCCSWLGREETYS